MITVLLALGGAIAYGLSDFVGGLVSRRTSVWPVALLACVGALLGSLLLALVTEGTPTGTDFAWGLLAGVGSGAGTAFLYHGLSSGRMGVVAPVSAVGAAVIPVVVGVVTGERPGALVWLGIVAALPGIWLVSQTAPHPGDDATEESGLVWGVLAGVAFGVLFASLGQVGDDAGFWPVTLNQVVSVVAVGAAALLLGGDALPRRRTDWWGLTAGLLASLAVLGFLLANQHGLLSVSAVLISLYPALTVLLAALVLRERIHRIQAAGLALCVVTVVCVALG